MNKDQMRSRQPGRPSEAGRADESVRNAERQRRDRSEAERLEHGGRSRPAEDQLFHDDDEAELELPR